MTRLPLHIALPDFDVRDNALMIGGEKLTDVVKRAGHTPLYIYDSSHIRRRVQYLRRSLPEAVKIHYAIKANPMPEIVNLLATLVDGLDVASRGELEVAIDCQLPSTDISFAGPGKRDEELERAISAGIIINVESSGELERASIIAGRQGARANVAIRVNPDFELKSAGMRMSGGPKPFGIDAEVVPQVLNELGRLNVRFHGFHIFSGSQNLRADAICEAQERTIELGLSLSRVAPVPPRFLNIGGGLGIPYFPGDQSLDLSSIGENLSRLVETVHNEYPETEVVIELGRYLVGEAGIYVCEIIDKKVSRGHTFLVTNGGLHHHLAASGNFGQVIRKNYPVLMGNRIHGDMLERVSVVGPLCTPLDILADKIELPVGAAGDLVVVMQSGAYGYTASPRQFLGHPDAVEMLL